MAKFLELIQDLKAGKKITKADWYKNSYIYYKDEIIYLKEGLKMEMGDIFSLFFNTDDDWKVYEEPIDWNYIIERKCLCWFWLSFSSEKIPGTLEETNLDDETDEYPYKARNLGNFDNCRPISKDEASFYEDKETNC